MIASTYDKLQRPKDDVKTGRINRSWWRQRQPTAVNPMSGKARTRDARDHVSACDTMSGLVGRARCALVDRRHPRMRRGSFMVAAAAVLAHQLAGKSDVRFNSWSMWSISKNPPYRCQHGCCYRS